MPGRDALLIPGDGGGYLATADGTVRALDRERGVRWKRSVDVNGGHVPLHGWLGDETADVAFTGGTIYRIQRESAGRTLFL